MGGKNKRLSSTSNNHISEVTLDSKIKHSFKTDWLKYKTQFLIIFCSAILLYANTAKHDYALDDQLAIYENKFVTQGISGIPSLLTQDAFVGFFGERGSKLISGGRYRPLSFITFAIEWEIFGRNPMINHIVNIVLFGFLCCLIFYFLTILFPSEEEVKGLAKYLTLPFIATMLYAFHPIHTEVVANIKGRDEILCFLFALWSIIYFFHLSRGRVVDIFLTAFLFFLALMSKENAITFLMVFPLVAWFQRLNFKSNMFSRHFVVCVVSAIILLVLRGKFTAVSITDKTTEILNDPFVRANFSEKFGTIFYSFLKYLQLLIFPHPLTHDYYYNQIPYRTFTDPMVLLSITLLAVLTYFLFKEFKNRSTFVFSTLFFAICFSIVSNLFFTVGIIMNERFVFIPSLGFCILLGYFILGLKAKIGDKGYFIILISILSLYAFKTVSRNMDWKDNFALFSADFRTSTNSAKVATSLGGVMLENAQKEKDSAIRLRQMDSSIEILKHSIEIYPEHSQTWLLLGNALYAMNHNEDEALRIYKHCVALRGNFFDANYNLGVLYFNLGKYDSALMYITDAHQEQPDHREAKMVYTKSLAKLGRTAEAIAVGGASDAGSMSNLALDAKDGGNYQEALSLASQALEINGEDAAANYVKGICLARYQNDINGGIPFMEKAVKNPSAPINWVEDLAVAYGMTGRIKESIPLLERVVQAKPTPQSYANLATSYSKIGNIQKATFYMNKAKGI
jgi:protein O-mannosyl-transferase